jgi:carboxynorspermidine decarboxylase
MSKEQTIQEFIESHPEIATPYYLIDESRLVKNMEKMAYVLEHSGAKAVLALKCFSTWSLFPLMNKYMAGTTSSSLYEAKLGHEKFGKETHAYAVGWKEEEVKEVRSFASKIIFNSANQLERFYDIAKGIPLGLRINPGISYSHFDLADPTRKFSRLGEKDLERIEAAVAEKKISGLMIHNQCENDDFDAFAKIVDQISEKFGYLLDQLEWVTLGGGILFTKEGYPIEKFAAKLKAFSEKHSVQVYLEPGEASVTKSGFLVTSVMDIIHNEIDVCVLDAAANVHMPDLVTYQEPARMELPINGPEATHEYQLTGRTCLAGDVFGTFKFPAKLQVGSLIPIGGAAEYTMVQKTWFNGVPMPSIVVKRLSGEVEVVRTFNYEEYLNGLS